MAAAFGTALRAGGSRGPETANARTVSDPGACVTNARQPPLSGPAHTLVLAYERGLEPPRTTAFRLRFDRGFARRPNPLCHLHYKG